MALELTCGKYETIEELITAAIGVDMTTLVGHLFIKYVQKTAANPQPGECGAVMSFVEKLKSAISIVECPEGNTIAVNVVLFSCPCLTCGIEIPCGGGPFKFDDLMAMTMVQTTDGEWAFYLGNMTDTREQN